MLDVFRAGGQPRQVVEQEAGAFALGVRSIGFGAGDGWVQAVQAGGHQTVTVLLAFGLRCLQLVAQRHQFIDFGDDAVLFGERW
ncbi:hypothetical protein MKFW12EY_11920 [Methylomonas koyamae]|nr:hypothetical protein MKFW12EY_11920 [Methylomonas koyamae]